MKNRVTELLCCQYPIIQGAMGVICNPEMVAAISDAGGYGLLDLGRIRIRALHTPLVEELSKGERIEGDFFGAKAMEESWLKGDAGTGVLPAGQISGLIHNVLSIRELIEEMAR